jgi:hypothetical protein
MSGVTLVFTLLVLVVPASVPTAAADVLRLTPKGVEALRQLGLPVTPSADGRAHVVQGRIIVARDEADRPTLPEPSRYFLFQPLGAAKPSRWEWPWVAAVDHHHIDTLDDLRGMLSNRDKRYGGWPQGLQALLADLDRHGTLRLKPRTAPPVMNAKIVSREGWLSRYLLRGAMTAEERQAMVRSARAKPKEDPLGYSPIDPLHWLIPPETTMGMLIEALGYARRYGEREPSLVPAIRQIAQFISITIYVPESAEGGPDGEKALRLRHFMFAARAAALALVEAASADFLADSAQRGVLQVTPPDDQFPLDVLDLADAALDVVAGFSVPSVDKGRVVEALLRAASGQADDGGGGEPAISNALRARQASVAARAFKTLVALSSVPPRGYQDLGGDFRADLVIEMARGQQGAAYVRAARDALAASGVGSEAEAARVVGSLVDLAFIESRFEDAAFVLRRIANDPTPAAVRRRFTDHLDRRIRELQERQKTGFGGTHELRFLRRWGAAP